MRSQEEIVLPSGKTVDAYGGFLGISLNGKDNEFNRFLLSSGRDDEISVFDSKDDYKSLCDFDYTDECFDLVLTAEDRKFLAELMIARWQEFGGIKEA